VTIDAELNAQAEARLHWLRAWARLRVDRGLPVVWYEDGHRCRAESRPDKSEGAWLICGDRCEYYRDVKYVLASLTAADAIGVEL
jgi:hypothetical protein